jgi:DNA-binding response OmpR family regulator
MKILVVEDDLRVASLLRQTLEAEGHVCLTASDGEAGLSFVETHHPDVVILDWHLPRISGIEVCSQIRQNKRIEKDPFILMLSGKNSESDRTTGLYTGADDYLGKPFSPRELAARIFALSRRTLRSAQTTSSHQVIATANFFIDPEKRQVLVQKAQILEFVTLTTMEFDLLYALAQHPSRVWSRTQLLDETRGIDFVGDDRAVDSVIKRLRKKIGEQFIKTHIRAGYSFEDATVQA